ncbi:MAG TPA: peptidase S9 family protein [Cytophagales bacterium]|nr:peptidase S9 family protein [Cytophagales bacterium]
MKAFILIALATFLALPSFSQRPIQPSDVYRLKSVSDPQLSPDGKWIAYVVSSPDSAKDKYDSDIWMVSWDGKENIRLTSSPESESSPRWSPDGKYLTFLSSRYDAKSSQLWKMDRRGGEAEKLTKLKVDISSYEWSPDAKKIVLVIKDQDPSEDEDKKKTKKPIAMDRYHFKQDGQGYLERKRNHLYVFDLATEKLDTITTGDYDNGNPAWSPDSRQLAFVSNRTTDADRNGNTDIWIVDAQQGAKARQLTKWVDSDDSPSWSPDGKYIAYLKSRTPEYDIYDQPQIAVVAASGGEPKIISSKVDRDMNAPRWALDGKSIYTTMDDDRRTHVVTFDVSTLEMKAITTGDRVFTSLQRGPDNKWVAMGGDALTPFEVYGIAGNAVNRLTHVHDEFLKPLALASVEAFNSKSKDGTNVGSLLVWPAGVPKNTKLPLILWIHGGPTSQDDFSFDLISQLHAANGYAVANVNYRGSNGRGMDYSRAIYADWGNKEVVDLLGAVDHLVKEGKADPDRLGVGGWSYGGILTDYITAADPRFKAAASGAGSALWFSLYGTDQYTKQYEAELGVPWKTADKWMKLSSPFFNIEKIKTPTLYMVGEKDFNVPPLGSEQMYQALKSLGVPTEFVVYPNQFHGIRTPSYQIDRYTRYKDWYAKYLDGSKMSGTINTKK